MKLFAAPMADISDSVFRSVCYRYGADHCVTEMISVRGVVQRNRRTIDLARIVPDETQTFVQLFGNDPGIFAEAISIISSLPGVYGFDINMGCPMKKVVKNGSGSALLERPDLIKNIVSAARASTDRPLTVKIRSGFNELNWERNCGIIQDAGADMIVIHPRLRSEFFSRCSDHSISVRAAEICDVPIIHSGDISSHKDIEIFAESGIFGVMIGRAARNNPGIFTEITQQRESTPEEHRLMVRDHLQLIIDHYGLSARGLVMLRKQAMYYTRRIRGGRDFRRALFDGEPSPRQILDLINDFFGTELAL